MADIKNSKREIEVLVVKAQAGDGDAFGKLYDLFVNPIYRYMFYRVGQSDAEDLTEMVFLKTWEHIKQYRPGQHSFSAWIFRIAHNLVVDNYRAHYNKEELTENIQDHRKEANTTEMARDHFANTNLEKAMQKLKDQYRQILVLKYINDMSNEEIVEITGKSHASLRILQFRALRSLRRIMEDMGITDFEK
jgi:RNA polymerase sigma-70 factor (ECF subfamily)